ncbi:NDP-hexose 2,3-dehydratase family protein [Oscillibacter sp.]|uniref:NDP-hexose 2,3-dehydratase family protein n=1 Tax=Oscillibacter sp. TaxID=1945593 RepID=UPI00289FD652|nr:NDP-hexose 2,3-dehydratase family protein [Oscillibacter sp.]
MYTTLESVRSWATDSGNNSMEALYQWVQERNQNSHVSIVKNRLSDSAQWFYDRESGFIHNRNNSFFQVSGLQVLKDGKVVAEQPILLQREIGYLGILCQKRGGVLYFLMQTKIEPGNVNCVQISPTIQATKSNFTQKHGGRKPAYLDYFLNAERYEVVVDQIQSEQSSRFWGKRNRNIIVYLPETEQVELLANFRWMTLRQLKKLMKQENLVNMDTRTVLSCIPFTMTEISTEELAQIEGCFQDHALYRSIFEKPKQSILSQMYHYVNNAKMFADTQKKLVPLHQLSHWEMRDEGIFCKEPYPFQVVYCNIAIEGREVTEWTQPLFEACGMAQFGLFTTVQDGVRKFLVRGLSEIGCFDEMEFAPTVQLEAGFDESNLNDIEKLFQKQYNEKSGVLYDAILSEEGGRFYHEQNYNRILEIAAEELGELPEGYFWVDYYTLNTLNQVNNCLNIQLRNLLSLLEV